MSQFTNAAPPRCVASMTGPSASSGVFAHRTASGANAATRAAAARPYATSLRRRATSPASDRARLSTGGAATASTLNVSGSPGRRASRSWGTRFVAEYPSRTVCPRAASARPRPVMNAYRP